MPRRLKATYRKGAFVLEEPCELPEGCEVELAVQGPAVVPPAITDPEEQKRILRAVVQRMRATPLPENTPRWTRDWLHDRN